MKANVFSIDTPNKNNRIYPRYVLENAINKFKLQIVEKRAFITSKIPEAVVVPLNDVIGLVTDLTIEGKYVIIDFEWLPELATQSMIMGFNMGELSIRPQGAGSMRRNNDGINIIQDDYSIICFSLTDNPA